MSECLPSGRRLITEMTQYKILLGDCLEHLEFMPDNSVDSIVTDPPYGLAFMGKRWDYDVPSIEKWAECLRVLKPGGHLLAFAGTRTQHRMAVRIEDAGFEIRDLIAWVYGSGFPKSLDVSKAIDKAAGVEGTFGAPKSAAHAGWIERGRMRGEEGHEGYQRPWMADAEAVDKNARQYIGGTDAARQWQGWGTALKPALETVTFASKPYTAEQERDIILSNLIRLEARLWLLSSASAAGKNSTSNQSEYGAACAIAQWCADEITNTQGALCDQMGTSLFELATNTSLNIVSSWRRTLAESLNDGSTSTIATKSSTTIDWRTLRFSLSQITPESIIKACSLPGGFSANATTAESHFNASLLLLQSIRTLSATEPAISQAQHEHLGAGVKPNLDPCIMARKPLIGTVAENVLAHGTGALNIDGCRVGDTVETWPTSRSYQRQDPGSESKGTQSTGAPPAGRWPANLIHDGSDEVLAAFPQAQGQQGKTGKRTQGNVYGAVDDGESGIEPRGDTGSAARFFYCAKASKRDRDDGLDALPTVTADPYGQHRGRRMDGNDTRIDGKPPAQGKNNHPTVKPTDLMRYLCRLVTPPGGVVLDPFMGSGSTGKAAMLEGFRFIGIEREADYVEIARNRILAAQREADEL